MNIDQSTDRKHSLPLDLSKCTALRTLHLRLQAFVEKNELHTQWLLTLDTLAHIPPTLENIIITLRLCHASQTPPNIEETILTRLDQILDHFTTLRILSIYPDICISDNGKSVVHPFSIGQQQAISAHLTRLSRKGILHFDVYHIAHCGYCRSCPPDEARSVSCKSYCGHHSQIY